MVKKGPLRPTSYVVLGLVEQMQPTTPYELKRAAAVSVTNFWSLPHTQLYLECGRLAEAGYLSERREDGGRRRRIYRLSRKGAEALERWRSDSTVENYELRDAGILKLYFGAEPARLAHSQVEAHGRKLKEYEAQLAEFKRHNAPEQIRLAVEAGIGHEREYVRFWSRLGRA
jgi:PadR family transcriptional regulator, regulatory protein AphA